MASQVMDNLSFKILKRGLTKELWFALYKTPRHGGFQVISYKFINSCLFTYWNWIYGLAVV